MSTFNNDIAALAMMARTYQDPECYPQKSIYEINRDFPHGTWVPHSVYKSLPEKEREKYREAANKKRAEIAMVERRPANAYTKVILQERGKICHEPTNGEQFYKQQMSSSLGQHEKMRIIQKIKQREHKDDWQISKILRDEPLCIREDKEVVLEAVKRDGRSLQYASDSLKDDREVVFTAVKRNTAALRFASEALQNDKEILLEALATNGNALQYMPDELRNDKDIVLKAMRQNYFALMYASNELQCDEELIKEAANSGHFSPYRSAAMLFERIKILEGNIKVLEEENAELKRCREDDRERLQCKKEANSKLEGLFEENAGLKEALEHSRPIEILDMVAQKRAIKTEDGELPPKRSCNETSSKKSSLALLAHVKEEAGKLVKVSEEARQAEAERANNAEKEKEEALFKLECPYCFEVDRKESYVLIPCGHVMCGICIGEIESCPKCGESTQIQRKIRLHK